MDPVLTILCFLGGCGAMRFGYLLGKRTRTDWLGPVWESSCAKLPEEDQRALCRLLGKADMIAGAGLALSFPLVYFTDSPWWGCIFFAGLLIWLGMNIYAYKKY